MTARFSDALSHCRCCPRSCGVDRLAGQTGYCRLDAGIRVSHAGLHFGEEPPISGHRGSGTVFFTGCNLRCRFCQNHQISQDFDPTSIPVITVEGLADEMLTLQAAGAHNINFVSPSHMVFQMADAIRLAKGKGLIIPIVYNSGGYDSVEALQAIQGLVDIYLPDLKYMDNALGRRYSDVGNYAEVASEAIGEMFRQVGWLEVDGVGVATGGLLVRHLVLPGQLDNSRRCLDFLAGLDRNIAISLMSQYAPRHRAAELPELARRLSRSEYDAITDYAVDLGLENVFIQALESQDSYLPDFERDQPFDAED